MAILDQGWGHLLEEYVCVLTHAGKEHTRMSTHICVKYSHFFLVGIWKLFKISNVHQLTKCT